MTDQEMNIAIAELCGWKMQWKQAEEQTWGSRDSWCTDPSGEQRLKCDIHDYCNDLNAMALAEEQLGTSDCDYVWHLAWNLKLDFDDRTMIDIYKVTHATAHERAEAFLRVKGKWIE
jgi:hypothetical protein